MARFVMTARRRAALKKAQLASARKRRKAGIKGEKIVVGPLKEPVDTKKPVVFIIWRVTTALLVAFIPEPVLGKR